MRWQKIGIDKKKRVVFQNLEVRLISIKSILKSQLLKSWDHRNFLLRNLFFYNKNCFFNKINNICVFTGRHRGVYRIFRISRIELRRSAAFNEIFGLKKSSW